MLRQSQWLDYFKQQKNFKSDYQLAKFWNVQTSVINQYRKERLQIPIALCLEIAEVCCQHPLEVILSLAFFKSKIPKHKERIKDVYFTATTVSCAERMSARAFSRKYRKYG